MREPFRREPFRPVRINVASVDIVGWPGLTVVLIIVAVAMEFPETRLLFLGRRRSKRGSGAFLPAIGAQVNESMGVVRQSCAKRLPTPFLWIRGLIFTVLVPLVVPGWAPRAIDPFSRMAGGAWNGGWLLVAAGAALYFACLLRFLAAGGTPAIFFTRPVARDHRRGAAAACSGLALRVHAQPDVRRRRPRPSSARRLYSHREMAVYGALAWLAFHLVVVLLEEPHLRDLHGATYDDYCRRVPRWLWVW